MGTVGARVRQIRELRGIARSELASLLGMPYSTLAEIENDRMKSSTKLHRIAEALKVRPDWLETGRGQRDAPEAVEDSTWADIRGVRTAAALGDGAQPDEYAETHKLKFRADSLRRKGLRGEQLCVIYGRGESMLPRIKSGDAILFDTTDKTPRDGSLYVVTYGRDLLAKQLVELGGRWFMQSLNKDDPKWRKPIPIDETKGFEIHGRVRWIGSWED